MLVSVISFMTSFKFSFVVLFFGCGREGVNIVS